MWQSPLLTPLLCDLLVNIGLPPVFATKMTGGADPETYLGLQIKRDKDGISPSISSSN